MSARGGTCPGDEPPSATPGAGGRPRLPDPQQDRHVAYPELTPTPKDRPEAPRPSSPRPPPSALPPDAWARQDPDPPATPASAPTWASHGAGRRSDPTSILPSDPTAASPKKAQRRWLPWAAVIGVFIIMGNANSGHDTSVGVSSGDGSYSQPMGPPGNEGVDGYVVRVVDPIVAPPLPEDTPVLGNPIPPGTTMVRIEVSSAEPRPVSAQVSTTTGLYETSVDTAPSALEVHVSAGTTHQLDVSLSDTSGDATQPVQCRIYLGHSLLAIGTGNGSASCSLTW